jgi:hypothetical protein
MSVEVDIKCLNSCNAFEHDPWSVVADRLKPYSISLNGYINEMDWIGYATWRNVKVVISTEDGLCAEFNLSAPVPCSAKFKNVRII